MNSWKRFSFVYFLIEKDIYGRSEPRHREVENAYLRYLKVMGEEPIP